MAACVSFERTPPPARPWWCQRTLAAGVALEGLASPTRPRCGLAPLFGGGRVGQPPATWTVAANVLWQPGALHQKRQMQRPGAAQPSEASAIIGHVLSTAESIQSILIEREQELQELLPELLLQPVVALDTESCSGYRYWDRVCLLQLSVPGRDYVVDALALDPRPLGALFAAPHVQKVLHAADQDIAALRRDYGFAFANVFDTMVAARLLGHRRCGLAALLECTFAIKLEKRFQRSDWSKRPLPQEWLRYAAADSHYLLPLRAALLARLERCGRLRQAERLFARACAAQPHPHRFDPEGYRRLPGAAQLDPGQLAVLRELYAWREGLARELDLAPYRVARTEFLLRLARLQPLTPQAIRLLLPRRDGLLRAHAPALAAAVQRGLEVGASRRSS